MIILGLGLGLVSIAEIRLKSEIVSDRVAVEFSCDPVAPPGSGSVAAHVWIYQPPGNTPHLQ